MSKRYLISGGGTGGHIFPALAIANKIKKEQPDAEFLFIGANDKMEMQRVPEAGYDIKGLTIYGVSRDFSWKGIKKNVRLPFVLLKAISEAKKAIKEFNPDIAIGVGGFASGPALKAAEKLGVPTMLQEQNSYPGVTNKMLAAKARKICVAYDGLEKYFPGEKIVKTGNPVRAEILQIQNKNPKAYEYFNFVPEKKLVLVVGGSLGARTLNETMAAHLDDFRKAGVQLLWQTGEQFFRNIDSKLLAEQDEYIRIVPFIKNMNDAYSIADIIVSRAGALAISELSIVGKPVILVPFPYAAEDHQTFNAKALSSKNAAILIPDSEAKEKLYPELMALAQDDARCKEMSENILQFAKPEAIQSIYDEIQKIVGK
ncbi:MAG: undecaprenyldiphospho-muramoylpentapeptide beta-N-acetylglucosaminyltransferase [Bacteroidales bacterium]|nr:undecaprenyldiphospho-muramoylpentapeptide beta-N-acetylglucosaminyltransferase [Bacteroidales bacterium]